MNFDLLEKQLNQISHNYYYQTYANDSLACSFVNDNKIKIHDAILYMRQYPEGVISLRYLSNDFFLSMINLIIQHGISVLQFQPYGNIAPNKQDKESRVFIHYKINA